MDDFIEIPSASENILSFEKFTVSVWFRSNSDKEGVIWDKRSGNNCSQADGPITGMAQTSLDNGNTLNTYVSSSSIYNLNSKEDVSTADWFNAVLVREGGLLTLYLNGMVEESVSYTPGIDFATTLNLFIGKAINCSGTNFDGDIDDFTIYAEALSGSQIKDLYEIMLDGSGAVDNFYVNADDSDYSDADEDDDSAEEQEEEEDEEMDSDEDEEEDDEDSDLDEEEDDEEDDSDEDDEDSD
jgi:hypothetical protein